MASHHDLHASPACRCSPPITRRPLAERSTVDVRDGETARSWLVGSLESWRASRLLEVDGIVVDGEQKGPSYPSYTEYYALLETARERKEAQTFANIQRRLHHHSSPAKGRKRTYGRVEKLLRRSDGQPQVSETDDGRTGLLKDR
ncbi:hypothetical protein TEQG_01640 [Trichophyton equinum CBS 127.97]|uniref:Uncharacterized protein n=1 Tax=Trichophyton equinum (strain ATCC MYA-4606 / CBS 127.97) TaxID=559882 RepID=F2PL07_TRIEC|nr:hypothetical protein TEQG_01640 [Trichophyton equinum CBS 127.97]